jgi:hypothetical protein
MRRTISLPEDVWAKVGYLAEYHELSADEVIERLILRGLDYPLLRERVPMAQS